ncbi:hypothetical protein SCHPADRAFT_939868 [Schizopora paradoxa]|uniref:F-box domain-containing protein n=1 Tax=Schizopora paradoxa TaxID=27342 RepID=A0A0H2SB25_9AGAM|nr:hypothetical protein SCHPADRAFT_939868 [Schizopora paradoxa]
MSIPQDGLAESTKGKGEDGGAFEVLADVVKVLRRANEFFKSQPSWFQSLYGSSSIPLSHDTFQAKLDVDAITRTTAVREAFLPAEDATYEAWRWISRQFADCNSQIRSLRLRSGLLALPDEILSLVLHFASQQEDDDPGVAAKKTINEAIKLSHVCSRFRGLIISAAEFWRRITPQMHPEVVSMCFSRCGAGVQIVISTSYQGELQDFARSVVTKARLWRRFEYTNDRRSHLPLIVHDLATLRNETIGCHTLFLDELSIRYPPSALALAQIIGNFSTPLHFYSVWVSPSLQRMFCENFVPVSFSGTNTLTLLSIHLSFLNDDHIFNTADLATFLSSCPSLAKFIMRLDDCTKVAALSENWTRITSRIGEVEFSFVYCSAVVASTLLHAVHFPAVRSMHLLCNSQELDDDYSDVHCQKALEALFPTPNEFPNLEHLDIEIREGPLETEPTEYEYTPSELISIPFHNLPHLRTLRLSTWSSPLQALPDDINLTKLTRLEISNCWAMEFSWFEELFTKIAAHRRHLGDGVMVPPLVVAVADAHWEEKAQALTRNSTGSNTIGGASANALPAENIIENEVVVPARE